MAFFAVLLGGLGAVVALILWRLHAGEHQPHVVRQPQVVPHEPTFGQWLWRAETALLGAEGGSGNPRIDRVANLVLGIAKLLVPSLFAGLILFKLLTSRTVAVFRKRVAVRKAPDNHDLLKPNTYFLAFRFYIASRLAVTDLRCRVLTVNWRENPTSGRVMRVRRLKVANPEFSVGLPQSPYTIQVPLWVRDVTKDDEGNDLLKSVQGYKVGDDDQLVVLLEGRVPALDGEFIEEVWFKIRDAVDFRPFGSIAIDSNVLARHWPGWEHFDE